MDFLDPKKRLQHTIILLTGYVLIAVAIVIATTILLYQAYGFGLGKNGTVIQNGLLFFSSQPHPATITLNNKLAKVKTNSRLVVPEGIYHVVLNRSGYHTWQRTVDLAGGSVEHFDYPLLFPVNLKTTSLHTYQTAPGLASESPDRRWLMIEQPGSMTSFEVYDLKAPTKAAVVISLPSTLLTKATSSESWLLGSWADDNDHVLLQHVYDGKTEYILVDRSNPDQSLNLTQTLSLGADPVQLTLSNRKFNQYYLYKPAAQTLQRLTQGDPTPVPVLEHVLAYQTYSDNTVLYATDSSAPTGKVLIKLLSGTQTYTVKSLDSGSTYQLDLTKYAGTLYLATGATSENKVYIYKDPIGQLTSGTNKVAVPVQVLHVNQPNYLSFSANAQFIVAEGGQQFGVYDIKNLHGYNFTEKSVLDAPQVHASWMDGDRLTYVSAGKVVVFDYDDANRQSLMPAAATYLPFFPADYRFTYTLAPDTTAGQLNLTQTSLLTPADQ